MEEMSSLYEDLMDGSESNNFSEREPKTFEDFHRKCLKLQKEQDMLVVTLTQMADENKRLVKERDNILGERSAIIDDKETIGKNFRLLETACRSEIKKLRRKISFLMEKAYPNQDFVSDSSDGITNGVPSENLELTEELNYSTILKVLHTNTPIDENVGETVAVKKKSSNQVFDCRPFNGPKTPPTPGGTEKKSHNRLRSEKEISVESRTVKGDYEHSGRCFEPVRYRPDELENEYDIPENILFYTENTSASEMMEYLDRHKDKFQIFRSWFSRYNDEKRYYADTSNNKKDESEFHRQHDDTYRESSYHDQNSLRLRDDYSNSRYRLNDERFRYGDRRDCNMNNWKNSQPVSNSDYYNNYLDRNNTYLNKKWQRGGNNWYNQNRTYRAHEFHTRTKYADGATYEVSEKDYRQGAGSREPDQEDLDFYKELWNRHKRELAKLGSTSISSENTKPHESFRVAHAFSESYQHYPKRELYSRKDGQSSVLRNPSVISYPHDSSSDIYCDRNIYRESEYNKGPNRSTSSTCLPIDENDRRDFKKYSYRNTSRPLQHATSAKESNLYSGENKNWDRDESRDKISNVHRLSTDKDDEKVHSEKKLITSVVILPKSSAQLFRGESEKSIEFTSPDSSGPTDIVPSGRPQSHKSKRQGRTKQSRDENFREELGSTNEMEARVNQKLIHEPRKKQARRDDSLDSDDAESVPSQDREERLASSPSISSKTHRSLSGDYGDYLMSREINTEAYKELPKSSGNGKRKCDSKFEDNVVYKSKRVSPVINKEPLESSVNRILSYDHNSKNEISENVSIEDDDYQDGDNSSIHRSANYEETEQFEKEDDCDTGSSGHRTNCLDEEDDYDLVEPSQIKGRNDDKLENEVKDDLFYDKRKIRLSPDEGFQHNIKEKHRVVDISSKRRSRHPTPVSKEREKNYESSSDRSKRKTLKEFENAPNRCEEKLSVHRNYCLDPLIHKTEPIDESKIRSRRFDKTDHKDLSNERVSTKSSKYRRRKFEQTDSEPVRRHDSIVLNEAQIRRMDEYKQDRKDVTHKRSNSQVVGEVASPARSRSNSFSPRIVRSNISSKNNEELNVNRSDHEVVTEVDSEEEFIKRSPKPENSLTEHEVDWHDDNKDGFQRKKKKFRDLYEEGEIADSGGEDGNKENIKKRRSAKAKLTMSAEQRNENTKSVTRCHSKNVTREREIPRSINNNYPKINSSLRARLGRRFNACGATVLNRRLNNLGSRFSVSSQNSYQLNKRGRLSGPRLATSLALRKQGAFDNRYHRDNRFLTYRRRPLH